MKDKPTLIDPTYSQEPLIMVASKDILKSLQNKEVNSLPVGYAWIKPEEVISFREDWANLLTTLGFVEKQEQALQIFDEMLSKDPDYFKNHLYAIKSTIDNHLACSVGLWYGSLLESKRIHWVMTHPLDQHQGLAKTALKKAMASFGKEAPNETLHLSTQAASWPAIVLYESLGFMPYLNECLKFSALESQKNWKEAKESVWNREKVVI